MGGPNTRIGLTTSDPDAADDNWPCQRPSQLSPWDLRRIASRLALLARLQNAWDNGSLWVALVWGHLGLPPPLLLFVDTIIAMFAVAESTPQLSGRVDETVRAAAAAPNHATR